MCYFLPSLDPGQELLCRCFVFQGTGPLPTRGKGELIAAALTRVDGKNESVLLHREAMMASLAAQLEGCKDVVAQSEAVAGLVSKNVLAVRFCHDFINPW